MIFRAQIDYFIEKNHFLEARESKSGPLDYNSFNYVVTDSNPFTFSQNQTLRGRAARAESTVM